MTSQPWNGLAGGEKAKVGTYSTGNERLIYDMQTGMLVIHVILGMLFCAGHAGDDSQQRLSRSRLTVSVGPFTCSAVII